jgi:hypothetical protein
MEYRYRLVIYELERPWVAVSSEIRSVELDDDEPFTRWAARTYPADHFRVIPQPRSTPTG